MLPDCLQRIHTPGEKSELSTTVNRWTGGGIRRARYDGLHKTHMQHVFTAVAINLVRIDAVLTQTPRGTTRRSTFARLAEQDALQDSVAA